MNLQMALQAESLQHANHDLRYAKLAAASQQKSLSKNRKAFKNLLDQYNLLDPGLFHQVYKIIKQVTAIMRAGRRLRVILYRKRLFIFYTDTFDRLIV